MMCHVNMWILVLLLPACAQLSVRLRTPWKGPSNSTLIQEAAECLSEIDASLFWRLLDNPSTWQDLVSPQLAQLCWYSLWNREYSARMEFYSALERSEEGSVECPVTVKHGFVRCGDLKLFDSDHFYRRGETQIVAYLDISDKDFLVTHQALVKYSEERNATYVLRHKDTRVEGPDFLGGYGAGMLARDMGDMYLENTTVETTTDSGVWKIGIFYTDVRGKLTKLLLNQNTFSQASEFLRSLPSRFDQVSKMYPSSQLTNSVGELSQDQHAGKNMLHINSHYVPNSFYSILQTLRLQRTITEDLIGLGLDELQAVRVLNHLNQRTHNPLRFPELISTNKSTGRVYINDLERDNKYVEWSTVIAHFVMPDTPSLGSVALNFFNLVVVIDLDKQQGLDALQSVLELYKQQWPLRIGFILLGNPSTVTWLMHGLAERNEDSRDAFIESLNFTNLDESTTIDKEGVNAGLQFCAETDLCGPANFILNGRDIDVDVSKINSSLETYVRSEKQRIYYYALSGFVDEISTDFFEDPPMNRQITDTPLASVEFSAPPDIGILLENPYLNLITFTFSLTQTDLQLAQLSLEFLSTYYDLGIRVRYLLYLSEVTDEWQSFLCAVYKLVHEQIELTEVERETECTISSDELRTMTAGSNGERFVLVNSRVVDPSIIQSVQDLKLAYLTEAARVGLEELTELLMNGNQDIDVAHLIEHATYLVLRRAKQFLHQSKSSPSVRRELTKQYSTGGKYIVKAVLNPLSTESQKLSELLEWLIQLGASVSVSYSPKAKSPTRSPIFRRFYRFLIKESFDEELEVDYKPTVGYTLTLDTETSWLTQVEDSKFDIDSIVLNQDTSMQFRLKSLVVEGYCSESKRESLPAGLQLSLVSSSTTQQALPMLRHGYFQFQAMPNAYQLQLAPGNSSEFFALISDPTLAVDNLRGKQHSIQVSSYAKYPSLLGETDVIDDTIHIYSPVSGKIFEKVLYHLMASTVLNTNSKVKFWLLDGFFSPGTAENIDQLSKALAFDYEFVSYKWPHWMEYNEQHERLMWEYKLAVTDVIFPLSLKRLLIIDADAFVRGDIKDVWEIDMQGAPYGYFPHCEPNPDVVSHQVWEQDRWIKRLNGYEHHMGTVILVDLVRFRSMGIADTLRRESQRALLTGSDVTPDQDIPCILQYKIPLYSLPRGWVWCGNYFLIKILVIGSLFTLAAF